MYTAFYDYKTEGKPPVRALVCDYPEASAVKDEFLFGDMIVAPIAPGKTGREIWLPEGEWYGFFDGRAYSGGNHYIDTEGIPVYVRAGSIIPLAKPVQYIGETEKLDITLKPFGDCKNSVCRLIEDDRETVSAEYRVIYLHEGDTVETEHYRVNQ